MKSLWLVGGALLAASCLVSTATRAAADDRVLEIVSPRQITTLEPMDMGYHFRRLRVAETLVGMDPAGNLVPELAESWSVGADGKTWRFKLRAGVRFHDGTAMTPEIVRAEVEKYRAKSEVLSTAPITGVALDGNDLLVTISEPFSLLPAYFTDATAIILAPSSFAPDGSTKAVVGTGPYRVTAIDGKSSISLEAFPDYWGEKAHIAKVHFTGVPAADTLANMAESGQADLILGLPSALKERVESSGRAQVKEVQTGRILGFMFDHADPRFDQVEERRALSLAIDRKGIAGVVFRNPESAANQLLSAAFPQWHDGSLPAPERNVDEAKKLLASVGWKPGGDGILTQDGKRFSFTVVVGKQPELTPLAQALQAQFREIGVEMDLKPAPSTLIAEAVKNGTFGAQLARRNYGTVPDPVATLIVDYGRANADKAIWGGVNYDNPDFEKALNDYVSSRDDAEQGAARERLVHIINTDLPILAAAWYVYGVSISNRVDVASVPIDAIEFGFWIDRVKWAE
ncbi:ABC transporter substrate-binding protein [Dongia sedimenti]|uniref:ABC transporter substrate-binding protein n=1 Tax=Dongia sedimenti TaxID=3064282 RepID=A0ABU0YRQ9_9PROT|nr:ABC transporter substrate-binding protein [Rhodospirillaceae bacterium R-7]